MGDLGDYRALDYETDFQVAESASGNPGRGGGGSGHGESHPSTWEGPARPGGQREWKRKDRGDSWWDPIEGNTKASMVPNNISPGESGYSRTKR